MDTPSSTSNLKNFRFVLGSNLFPVMNTRECTGKQWDSDLHMDPTGGQIIHQNVMYTNGRDISVKGRCIMIILVN